MRSFTLNYGSGSRRAFNSSIASCFCMTSNRCDCGHLRSSRFCKGASSSRLGSRRPEDSISVRRWGAHNPTIWFMGSEPVKSWNSLRACFYGRVSSIQKEKLFTPIVFFYEQLNFRHAWHLRYIWSTYFSSNIVSIKVTL